MSRTGPLVLYVDDERPNRVVFEQSLGADFAVRAVADGPSALEVLAQQEVAVVVTDMRMPGMTGEELLRIVRERYPQAVRMVVTAFADVDPILRAINEGLVARYILKPWQHAELVQVLRWAIEAYTLSRDSATVYKRLVETERLVTLGSMLAMMVHDLKNPLTALTANLEFVHEIAGVANELREAVEWSDLDPRRRAWIASLVADLPRISADLRTGGEHLAALIQRLLDFARKPSGVAGPPAMTDPLPVVRHAITVCQKLTLGTGTIVDYRGPAALPQVRIHETELMQVLLNLVSNGAQAVAARGKPNCAIEISARTDDGMLEIAVHDEGAGMPPEVLSRVGTPFFTTRTEGTGLGLAQCQRLVGAAGGRMRIDSEVGKGTTVTILLPLAA